jgi:hypothetical protein
MAQIFVNPDFIVYSLTYDTVIYSARSRAHYPVPILLPLAHKKARIIAGLYIMLDSLARSRRGSA